MPKLVTHKPLTEKQFLAIEGLIRGGTVTAAAQAAGVSRKTVYAWLSDDWFKIRVGAMQDAIQSEVRHRLLGLVQDSVSALKDGLMDDEPMQTRLRAAEIVFSKSLAWQQHMDLDRRLRYLESAAAQMLKELYDEFDPEMQRAGGLIQDSVPGDATEDIEENG